MIKTIKVEVPYFPAVEQLILWVEVAEEVAAMEAVEFSGIGDHFADIDMDQTAIGNFSKPFNGKMLPMPGAIPESNALAETCLPLLINPKQARLNRAPKERV